MSRKDPIDLLGSEIDASQPEPAFVVVLGGQGGRALGELDHDELVPAGRRCAALTASDRRRASGASGGTAHRRIPHSDANDGIWRMVRR